MDVPALLRANGLRRTPVRQAVLRLLLQARRPLTHGQVADALGQVAPDRVTLYRALTALDKASLVHRVQGMDGAWRFCAHSQHTPGCPGGHAHFQCIHCAELCCLLDQPLPWVAVPAGAEVGGKQFVVYGRCARCAAAGGEE